jgi:hypothetical protein
MYTGLFVLPLVIGSLGRLNELMTRISGKRKLGIVSFAWATLGCLWLFERLMPLGSSWFTTVGLGPIEAAMRGYGKVIFTRGLTSFLTIACFLSLIFGALILLAEPRVSIPLERERKKLLGLLSLLMTAGVLPTAFVFYPTILDRYLLPLLPFALLAILTGLRSFRFNPVLAVGAILLFAMFSAASVRDSLMTQQTVWNVAQSAVDSGVPLMELDAGAGWDGWHFGVQASEQGLSHFRPGSASPWWLSYYAPQIVPKYVVSLSPLSGYRIVSTTEYFSWVGRRTSYVYLLRAE